MIKHYCDCCEKEVTDRLYPIQFFVHVKDPFNCHSTMVDDRMIPFSGRQESVDLCIGCYNDFMFPLMDDMKKKIPSLRIRK